MGKLALEDFGSPRSRAAPGRTLSEDAVEDLRLAAFEDGYRAGWDDAAKANEDDQRRIGTALARNLEDLSFTYAEAQAQMLDALRPVIDGLLAGVLPDLAYRHLGERLRETVLDLARGSADLPVEILVAPDQVAALSELGAPDTGPELTVSADPGLITGQARIRIGSREAEIDMPAALAAMHEAVAAFYDQLHAVPNDKEQHHG